MRIAVYIALVIFTAAALGLGMHSLSSANGEISREEVEVIVKEYLMENPQVIVDSLNKWQEKQAEEQAKAQVEAIKSATQKLAGNTDIPAIGADEGNPTIVEFFDYNCPYCKTAFESIDKLLKADKEVRVLFIEYPIFGEESNKISRIALAVHEIAPEKYMDFHANLMRMKGRITADIAHKLAVALGVNGKKIDEIKNSDAISKMISDNRAMANELGVKGTPAFVIGDEFSGGALSFERLQATVNRHKKQ